MRLAPDASAAFKLAASEWMLPTSPGAGLLSPTGKRTDDCRFIPVAITTDGAVTAGGGAALAVRTGFAVDGATLAAFGDLAGRPTGIGAVPLKVNGTIVAPTFGGGGAPSAVCTGGTGCVAGFVCGATPVEPLTRRAALSSGKALASAAGDVLCAGKFRTVTGEGAGSAEATRRGLRTVVLATR